MVVKGKKLTQKDYYNKLKEELRSMETPRDKLEHLWEYYKWIPAVFLGFVAIISMVIAAIISPAAASAALRPKCFIMFIPFHVRDPCRRTGPLDV